MAYLRSLACLYLSLHAIGVAGEPLARLQVGDMLLEGVPPVVATGSAEVGPYLEYRSARLLGWLNDSLVIRTRFGATDQLHRVDSPLGSRQQLTFYPEPVRSGVTAGESLVFLKDTAGDEQYQLLLWRAEGATALTTPGTRSGSPIFSQDGQQLAYNSNARDGVHWDIFVADLPSGASRRVTTTTDGAGWYPLDFSADGDQLLLQQYHSINDSRLWIVALDSGALTPVNLGAKQSIGVGDALFDRGGNGILVSADLTGEFQELYRLDGDGRVESLSAHIPWDVTAFDQSHNGHLIALASNENGIGKVSLLDEQAGMELTPPPLPTGTIDTLKFQPGGERLGLSLQSSKSPSDVWVLDWAPTPAWVRWTASETGSLDPARLVEPRLVHFESFDRTQVPAFVYEPTSAGPHPVVVYIHGGPESQFKPGFHGHVQFLVNELGFAVVAPNVRGSAGYGKRYLRLDNGQLRKNSVKDIGALLDWLTTQPALDQRRTVVMGGSYGGYMVLASLVDYGDRLLGGIERVGISNFVTFLENTSPYRQNLRRAEYGDERDPEIRKFLEAIAPLNHASKITKPLLILQGANDPRVPQSESEQMVATIRDAGGEVWYLLALNEGHGLRRKDNQRLYLETVGQFLNRLAR
jgi:dipeptidyl aminopeptidase/acylaminoacyl peptidase